MGISYCLEYIAKAALDLERKHDRLWLKYHNNLIQEEEKMAKARENTGTDKSRLSSTRTKCV